MAESTANDKRRLPRGRVVGRLDGGRGVSAMPSVQPVRVHLQGVPRVAFFCDWPPGHEGSPEDLPFPACLRAALTWLGEDPAERRVTIHGRTWRSNRLYPFLVGVSGVAFKLSWQAGWQLDNVGLHLLCDDPAEPFRRAFEAVGYRLELLHRGEHDEARFRQAIVESLRDRGRPVIAHGVIGPPEDCLITGYDEGGEVLIGWNFFQSAPPFRATVELEPTGEFRRRGWFAETWSLALMGDKIAPPPLEEVLRRTVEWAVAIIRTPLVRGAAGGLAAYDAWAEHLLRDQDFAGAAPDVLRERLEVHDDAVGTVAEARWYGAQFLADMAHADSPRASHLLRAAACYAGQHELMWRAWGTVGGMGRDDQTARRLAAPEVRRQLAALVREARDLEARAADHLSAWLSAV